MMLYNKRFLLGSIHLDGYLIMKLGKTYHLFTISCKWEKQNISIKIKFVIIIFFLLETLFYQYNLSFCFFVEKYFLHHPSV